MKHLLSLAIIILVSFSLFAQNENIETLNVKIENNIFKKPDSAKVYLFQLLKHASKLEDTVVAKAYSHLGITYNQLGVYDSSEYYFKRGLKIAQKHPLLQAKLYSNLAINYRTNSEYSKSLSALDTAMSLYEKAGDLKGTGVVYGEMASNYSYMLQKEKAITYLKKAIDIFETTKEPRIYIMQQKLANAYFNNENFEFAIDLYEQALPKFAEKKAADYYLTLPAYGESLIQVGRTKEGEERLLEAYNGLKEINNKEYMYYSLGKLGVLYSETDRRQKAAQALSEAYVNLRELRSSRFLEVARRYLHFLNQEGEYNQGMEVIAEVEKTTDNFRFKLNAEDELNFLIQAQKTYRGKQLFEQSLEVFDRVDFLKDSLKNATDQINIIELEASYQNQIQRQNNLALSKNNKLLKENSVNQGRIIILTLIVLVLLILVSLILYKSHRKKLAFQKDALENLKKTHAVLEENRELQHDILLEKENSLNIKEQELVTMSMEIADIQSQIRDLVDGSKETEISQKIADKIKRILDDKNYWQYFKTKFIEIYPTFGKSLLQMFPSLSENELAFCGMLKLQLSNKEIASLMGVPIETVVSKKYRIMNKMSLQGDEEQFDKLMKDLL